MLFKIAIFVQITEAQSPKWRNPFRALSIYTQTMQNYKPCLFLTDSDKGKSRDSQEWNIYVKSIPFKVFSDRKDIASRDWPEES